MKENQLLRAAAAPAGARLAQQTHAMIGDGPTMRRLKERLGRIADSHGTVLISGESGTGKEVAARWIHQASPRAGMPFLPINCAALATSLLESELFGHEKGAFTGAIDARKGLFELADGGTIFLDEIGDMPLTTQTKLLRVLEQREFQRVGAEVTIKVDVRIVAATNQNLRHLVATGGFRRDLYFRLNVLSIELPPLRDRRADIPLLVESFVREASDRNARKFPGISPEAMEILTAYSWPGNIRELKNLVESMVVLSPGRVIGPEDIPEDIRSDRGASLLPVPISRTGSGEGGTRSLRPELEFVFRTLVELRVDMDDLRREFDVYRGDTSMHLQGDTIVGRVGTGQSMHEIEVQRGIEIPGYSPDAPVQGDEPVDFPEADVVDEGIVVFRPGMTIDEMERRAITAALNEVQGNRRKAAELLGIGERTLYRKISKYDIEV